jgi:hypothetical protein
MAFIATTTRVPASRHEQRHAGSHIDYSEDWAAGHRRIVTTITAKKRTARLEHDAEMCEAVFGRHHALT